MAQTYAAGKRRRPNSHPVSPQPFNLSLPKGNGNRRCRRRAVYPKLQKSLPCPPTSRFPTDALQNGGAKHGKLPEPSSQPSKSPRPTSKISNGTPQVLFSELRPMILGHPQLGIANLPLTGSCSPAFLPPCGSEDPDRGFHGCKGAG